MGGNLQSQIKKRQPFESLEQEALLNLVRTSDRFQFQVARTFREYGLTPSQYNVLRILRGEGKPLPILEVADRMVAMVPGITGVVDRLEATGLVVRERSCQDRRVVYVAITAKALETLAAMDGPLDEMQRRLIGHLTQAELKDLIRLLEKARTSLGETPE